MSGTEASIAALQAREQQILKALLAARRRQQEAWHRRHHAQEQELRELRDRLQQLQRLSPVTLRSRRRKLRCAPQPVVIYDFRDRYAEGAAQARRRATLGEQVACFLRHVGVARPTAIAMSLGVSPGEVAQELLRDSRTRFRECGAGQWSLVES